MLKSNTKKIVLTGVLAAVSSILMIFPQFPIFPAFPWLDIDFSDVPALLASISISPLIGGIIVLIKNIIHLSVTKTFMLGEISNFLIGAVFVVSAGILSRVVFKNKAVKRGLLLTLLLASTFQIITAILVNLFIMIPLYSSFVNFEEIGIKYYILAGVIPFNIIKNLLACTVFYLIHQYAYPILAKKYI